MTFDLDAYLDRIGLDGRPTIHEVHRAHATSIPFENLDPHCGIPISLQSEDLQRKLIGERRGGYCFEQNLLLAGALEALGAQVQMLLARVRRGAEPGIIRPRSHLVLRVRDRDGVAWHADVGFGAGTLLEPIPFGAGAEHEQAGWRYRVIEEGEELVLQNATEDGWADVYGFAPQPVPFVDLQTSNWFTCTHPNSPFVTGLIVTEHAPDGSRLTLSDWSGLSLTEQTPTSTEVTAVHWHEVPALLAERFSLPGYELGPETRLIRTRHPS